mmetsp:Transcript_15067/g.38715  ORF Transcript_15067/g.38715 Transcript_15067/m.38715 type:complete len:219 (+) Transcript_15067:247-903(+)
MNTASIRAPEAATGADTPPSPPARSLAVGPLPDVTDAMKSASNHGIAAGTGAYKPPSPPVTPAARCTSPHLLPWPLLCGVTSFGLSLGCSSCDAGGWRFQAEPDIAMGPSRVTEYDLGAVTAHTLHVRGSSASLPVHAAQPLLQPSTLGVQYSKLTAGPTNSDVGVAGRKLGRRSIARFVSCHRIAGLWRDAQGDSDLRHSARRDYGDREVHFRTAWI